MPAYIVVGLTIKNAEKLTQYAAEVPLTLIKYQGEFIFKGPVIEHLSSAFEFEHQAVLSFPSKELAHDWYHSEEYQSLIPLRDEALNSQFQLIG